MRALIVLAMMAACSTPEAETPGNTDVIEDGDFKRILEEGTPEAHGVLTFLNDASTTVSVLDERVGLDQRAALNLIGHRDGGDMIYGTQDDDVFDTIAEVDDVFFVGDAAMRSILAYATAKGFVPESDSFYGMVEGVTFTKDQATGIVNLANSATVKMLDDEVGLDQRAAENIVDTRPFFSVEDVAEVSYVGVGALYAMRDWVDNNEVSSPYLTTEEAFAKLNEATKGLWWMSESDEVLDVFSTGSPEELTRENAASIFEGIYCEDEWSGPIGERGIEVWTLAQAFNRYDATDEAVEWRAVRAIFEDELLNPQVYRFGDDQGTYVDGVVHVFVVGTSADGDLVGFYTKSVET